MITIKTKGRSLAVVKDLEGVAISIGNLVTGEIIGTGISKEDWDKIVESINKEFKNQ